MFDELEENKLKEQKPTSWIGVIIAVCILPMPILLSHFGRPDMATPSFIYLGILVLAVGFGWDLRTRVWFWITIAVVLALHVVLLLKVPWPHFTENRITLLPFGVADLLVDIGIIQFVKKFIVRDTAEDEQAD
jgi:hypothetical protein